MSSPPRHTEPPATEARPSLVNRSSLRRVLESAQLKQSGVGVVYLDVDRFHQINTRWGRTAGDRVLDLLGPRLASRLPEGAVLTATEGDAYLAVLPGADSTTTRSTAEGLLNAVREAIDLADISLSLGASAGFSCQNPGEDRQDLVEHAFLACRRAKATARGTVVGYEVTLGADAARHQRTEDGLRRAIAEGQLRLHVQPTLDLRDGRVVGVEALVRWQHPIDGLLRPADFLPVAEAAGLMAEIGDWVLEEALALAAQWRDHDPIGPLRVWVNLATQQLADGDRLCARVRAAIEQGFVKPVDIGFEVTESSLLEDLPSAVEVLRSLRALGVEIALDDFGTGYSSLSYLRRLPVTAVKIDRVFVAGLGGSLADGAIVEAVIDLAHALGLRVIAEGVEDDVQANALIRMGADEAQGYYFSVPLPAPDVVAILGTRWCGATAPALSQLSDVDRRADQLPGFGSPRSRLLLTALDTAYDSIIVTAAGPYDDHSPIEQVGPLIVYVNAAFEAETGYRARDVVGRTLEFLIADRNAGSFEWYAQVYRDRKAVTFEVVNLRADGTTFLCEVTMSPILDERDVHTHWLHVRRNLTQRRSAEGDRARFQGLIEQSSSLVILIESGGNWVYVNAAQRRALGMGQDEPLDGVSIYTMYNTEQVELINTVVLPTIEREGRWTGPVAYVNRVTGVVTEVESDVEVVADPLRPGVRIFASVSRDVTELNALAAAERRRRELGSFAAELAQHALDQGSDQLFADSFTVLAPFAELLNADLAYLDAIDLDAGVLRPLGDWTSARYELPLVPPREIALDTIPRWIERLQRSRILLGSTTQEKTTPWAAELEVVFGEHPGGVNLYAPLRVNGLLVGVLGLSNFDSSHAWSNDEIETVQQVADTLASLFARQRADAAVYASEAHLAAMLANVDDVLVVIDPTGHVRYANSAMERGTGHPIVDVVGRHFLDFILPDDHGMAIDNFATTVSGREERSLSELRVLRPDGSSTWFEVDTSGNFDDVLGGFVLTLRDVSARRSAVEAAGRRRVFDDVVLEVARWALATESEMPFDGIEENLGRLANAVGCNRVVVSFVNDDIIETVARWSADGRVATNPDGVAQRRSPAFIERLRRLEPLAVTDLLELDEPWVAELRARPEPSRSALHVPLLSGDRCVGDIEISMSDSTRVWTNEEISLVQRISETLASLLARQRLEASLRKSEARLGAFLDGSHDLVVVVDDGGGIVFTNEAVHRRLGYRPEELIGRNASLVIHPDDVGEAMRRLGTLVKGQPTMMTTLRLISASGAVAWWEITSGARRDPMAGGSVLICREVSARLRAEGENEKRVEHLRYAFDLAQSALDVGTTEFLARLDSVCASIAVMLGADRVYVDHIDEHNELLINRGTHLANQVVTDLRSGGAVQLGLLPAWIETLRSAEPLVVGDLADHDAPWVDEKRRSLGTEAALMAVGMSAAGELVGVVGVSMVASPRDWTSDEVTFLRIIAETIANVFERSRVDEALRSSEARFRLLSETAADVVILIDATGVIRYASPSSMGLLGFTPDDLVGRPARSLMDPRHLEFFTSAGPALLTGSPFTAEGRMVRADGSVVWVANSTSAVIDPDSGRAIEYRTSVRDITERKRLEAELVRQALHDPLTGLANRMLLQSRLLDATAHREPLESDSDAAHVSVLLLDLDGFKEVNDTYGHAIGDEVLRVVAARLAALTRPSDTLARTGGDEFVVLCPATDSSGAVLIGERCVSAINQPILVNGVTVGLGASVGVAHHAGVGADPDSLLLDADGAMYTAKQLGRGRVALANSASRAFGRYPQNAESFSMNSPIPVQPVP